MSGGASYVLSREALHRFMSEAYSSEKICPAVKEWGIEDFYMGVCLQNVGVHFIDSQRALPEENKTKFFPLDVGEFVSTNNDSIPDWLPQMSVSRIETVCAPLGIVPYMYNSICIYNLIYSLSSTGQRLLFQLFYSVSLYNAGSHVSIRFFAISFANLWSQLRGATASATYK